MCGCYMGCHSAPGREGWGMASQALIPWVKTATGTYKASSPTRPWLVTRDMSTRDSLHPGTNTIAHSIITNHHQSSYFYALIANSSPITYHHRHRHTLIDICLTCVRLSVVQMWHLPCKRDQDRLHSSRLTRSRKGERKAARGGGGRGEGIPDCNDHSIKLLQQWRQ